MQPVVNGFFTDLDDFRTKYASLYFALPGDGAARRPYEMYSDHAERTQRVGKRTAYRVDVTTRIEFEDGASAPIRVRGAPGSRGPRRRRSTSACRPPTTPPVARSSTP